MENCNDALLERIQELETQLHFYRDYDLLTGLYNKDSFFNKAEKLLSVNKNGDFEIIYINIEHFKLVNDLYGSEQGNHLLHYIARQLKLAFAMEKVRFARLRADIFVILRPFISVENDQTTADQLQQIFQEYPLDMQIQPAIGFYRIEDSSIKVNLMCDRAALAADSVKGNYSKRAAWYSHKMRNILIEEQELLSGLDDALKNGEFEVYIQPKCNMHTGKITGGEALVRWNHPLKGLISPASFIPVFEKNGFIKDLDQYVWEQTAKWLHKRKSVGLPLLPISVNISRIDVFGIDIFAFFTELTEKYELEPHWMELEITESAYINRVEEVIGTVDRLMEGGFTVLMDDFGSGFSSLNMLKDISIDILKLDMRFLDSNQKRSRNILESVVRMARWLDLKIIAEGVEQQEQIDFLMGIGCTYAQGFYYYRPMPIKEYEELLDTQDTSDFCDTIMSKDSDSTLIHLRDFLSEDVLSEIMLNNILGIVVLYTFDGQKVKVTGGNIKYYQTLHSSAPVGADVSYDAMELIHVDDRPAFLRAFEESKTAGDSGAVTTIRRYLDGDMLWLQLKIFFLSETNGNCIYYAAISDSSPYIKAMEYAKIAEKCFRVASEISGDVIFEVDIKTRVAHYTLQGQKLFGQKRNFTDVPEGFIRQGFLLPQYKEVFCNMFEEIFNGVESASCKVETHLADGGVTWNLITLTSIKNQNGDPVKAVGIVKNIS